MILILFWLEFLAQRRLSGRSLLEMDGWYMYNPVYD